jgi:hypothetical protein
MSPQAREAVRRISLEEAVAAAFTFLRGLEKPLRAHVYGLEETDRDERGRWLITISLTRRPARARTRTVPRGLLAAIEREPNPEYVYRTVVLDPTTGEVLRMRSPRDDR